MYLIGLAFLFPNLLEAQFSHSSSSRKIRGGKLKGPKARVATGGRCLFPSAGSGPVREERSGASCSWGKVVTKPVYSFLTDHCESKKFLFKYSCNEVI